MSNENKDYIKNNWSKWVNVSTLFVVIGFVINQSKWQQKVDNHIEQFNEHKSSLDLHIPLKDQMVFFVPRTEIQVELNAMKTLMVEIKEDLKELKRSKN